MNLKYQTLRSSFCSVLVSDTKSILVPKCVPIVFKMAEKKVNKQTNKQTDKYFCIYISRDWITRTIVFIGCVMHSLAMVVAFEYAPHAKHITNMDSLQFDFQIIYALRIAYTWNPRKICLLV